MKAKNLYLNSSEVRRIGTEGAKAKKSKKPLTHPHLSLPGVDNRTGLLSGRRVDREPIARLRVLLAHGKAGDRGEEEGGKRQDGEEDGSDFIHVCVAGLPEVSLVGWLFGRKPSLIRVEGTGEEWLTCGGARWARGDDNTLGGLRE